MSKYRNSKITVNGMVFDSKKEAKRFNELSLLEKSGDIEKIERQVKFVLIPAQREPDTIGPRGGIKQGKLIEKECSYIADFVYYDRNKMEVIVEDVKGFRTESYKIKRKLMLWRHGIRIKEV